MYLKTRCNKTYVLLICHRTLLVTLCQCRIETYIPTTYYHETQVVDICKSCLYKVMDVGVVKCSAAKIKLKYSVLFFKKQFPSKTVSKKRTPKKCVGNFNHKKVCPEQLVEFCYHCHQSTVLKSCDQLTLP